MINFVDNSYQLIKELSCATEKEKVRKEGDIDEERGLGECDHTHWIFDKSIQICTDCGMMKEKDLSYEKEWRYYGLRDTKHYTDPNRCSARKQDEKSIGRDVEKLGFNDKTISYANHIYEQVTQNKIFRGNTRRGIIFACIFHAHKMVDNPYSCDCLIEIFQINRKTALKGLKYVNLNLSKDLFPTHHQIDTRHLIREIMLKFNANESKIQEVIRIFEIIQDRSSLLNRSRPQSVACGIVRYYMIERNHEITASYFRSKVRLSELTIHKILKEIYRILDQTDSIPTIVRNIEKKDIDEIE